MPAYRLGLVLTGGTIGSLSSAETVRLRSAPPADAAPTWLTEALEGPDAPELLVQSPLQLHSEEARPQDWQTIAAACRRLREQGAEGICVLHGTDTMPFTAAALSLTLADLDVPVALTGSNLSPDRLDSDAGNNVRSAVVALRALSVGTYLVFAGTPNGEALVHLGTRVRKEQASGTAFHSPDGGPVARVVAGRLEELRTWPLPQPLGSAAATFDPRVLGLHLHPGLPFAALEAAVTAGDLRGVVVELYPCGTGPTGTDDASLQRFARFVTARGGVVIGTVAATPNGAGASYPSLPYLQEAGTTVLPGMLGSTATVKLMWALAATGADPDRTHSLMRRGVAGELSVNG